MNQQEIESFLINLGVPVGNASAMAQQLQKRAKQLAEKRNQSYEEMLTHLINLLKQGWAAKQKE
jgi:hypothetical protein